MATTRSFSDMLNEYLPYELLEAEMIKRNYVMRNIEKDNSWKGGNLVVPFYGSYASSFQFGSLTADTDIAEDDYVRGGVSGYKELWGSMLFNARDLAEHDGTMSEQSFLKDVTKNTEMFLNRMSELTSTHVLVGQHFATLTADGDTGGTGWVTVDHPERFTLGQKIVLYDTTPDTTTFYVISINLNTKVIVVSATRGGAAASAAAFTTAASAKVYHPGAEPGTDLGFTSIPSQLLSLANGGSTALFGQTKTAYPYLQATNVSGSAWTAGTVLDDLFDAWTEVQKLGLGRAKQDAVLDYNVGGAVLKKLQSSSGPFRFVKSRADLYGWTDISVVGVRGELTISMVHEADADKVLFLDWGSLKFHTNGMFMYQKDPEGKMYFTKRNTTGYQYIVDAKLFGEVVVNSPTGCGIVYAIPSSVS